MRLSLELCLLLALALLPILILAGMSVRFPVPTSWLLVTCAWSIIASAVIVMRIHQRFVRPLQLLINNLYANVDSSTRHQAPELRQLDKAIRIFTAGRNVDAIDRIETLEQHLRNSIRASQSDEALIVEERELLQTLRHDIDDEIRNLDIRTLLAHGLTRKLLATANAGSLGAETLTDLEDLQFLLGESNEVTSPGSHDLLLLVDCIIGVTAPLARRQRTAFHVEFAQGCPRHFVLDGEHVKACLFHLIVDCLRHDPPAYVFIKIDCTNEEITFSCTGTTNQTPAVPFSRILKTAGASLRYPKLVVPATQSVRASHIESNLTAVVIAENEQVRSSLVQRLVFLGVNCIAEFGKQDLDICMVTNEKSEAFLAVKPYLSETTSVLMLGNHQHYTKQNWITVGDPVTQIQLQQILTLITVQKDISRQKNVLVVDDAEVNIQLLEMQLGELGHSVTIARSGEAAVSMVKKGALELVFMDIQMPGIDGLEATRRIRQFNQLVPIVGLTAHATPQERQKYLETGMNEVVIKPIRMENLRVMMHRLGKSGGFPPIAASGEVSLPVFDLDISLANADDRPDLAAELFDLLLTSLPADLDAINRSSDNLDELKRAVHKLHGAVRYCGVPRLTRAIEKLENSLKRGDETPIRLLLNLLNGEVTALNTWRQDNPDVLASANREISHR